MLRVRSAFAAFLFLALFCSLHLNAKSPTKVALVLNSDGKYFSIQRPISQGVQAFFKDKPDIELVEIKTDDTLSGQMEAAAQVKAQKIRFVIGHNFSSMALAFLKLMGSDYEYLYLSPLATSSEIVEQYPNTFMISPSNKLQVEALTRFLKAKKLEASAPVSLIVNESEPYSVEMAALFAKGLKNLGTTKIRKISYLKDSFDADAAVRELSQNKSKLVFLPSYSYDIIKLYEKLLGSEYYTQVSPIVVSGDSVGKLELYQEKLKEKFSKLNGEHYFTASFDQAVKTSKARALSKIYSKTTKSKEPLPATFTMGYETAEILYRALNGAKGELEQTRKQLLTMRINTSTGDAKFTKNRTLKRPVVIKALSPSGMGYHGSY